MAEENIAFVRKEDERYPAFLREIPNPPSGIYIKGEAGAIATARFALEQGRDVFVVPGNVAHPNFKGSHALIRQGAELVTSPDDVFSSYGVIETRSAARLRTDVSPEERLILEALAGTHAPAEVDKLVELTKLEPHIAMRAFSLLFVKGLVRETGSRYTMN